MQRSGPWERIWRSSSSSNASWKFVPVKQRHDETESERELIALVETIHPPSFLLS
jgi:hypothetical protein